MTLHDTDEAIWKNVEDLTRKGKPSVNIYPFLQQQQQQQQQQQNQKTLILV